MSLLRMGPRPVAFAFALVPPLPWLPTRAAPDHLALALDPPHPAAATTGAAAPPRAALPATTSEIFAQPLIPTPFPRASTHAARARYSCDDHGARW